MLPHVNAHPAVETQQSGWEMTTLWLKFTSSLSHCNARLLKERMKWTKWQGSTLRNWPGCLSFTVSTASDRDQREPPVQLHSAGDRSPPGGGDYKDLFHPKQCCFYHRTHFYTVFPKGSISAHCHAGGWWFSPRTPEAPTLIHFSLEVNK